VARGKQVKPIIGASALAQLSTTSRAPMSAGMICPRDAAAHRRVFAPL